VTWRLKFGFLQADSGTVGIGSFGLFFGLLSHKSSPKSQKVPFSIPSEGWKAAGFKLYDIVIARSFRKWSDPEIAISPPGELHAALAGVTMVALAKFLAPEPEEIQRMLLELRKEHRWSQGFAASVLGVSVSALSKWETGLRTPNGAAAKLIFLLYHVLMKTGKVKNAWDLTVWGRSPSRNLDDILTELNGTFFVTSSQFDQITTTTLNQEPS
jgi:DNA-binding transcriptional regulator YiaG